MRWVWVLFVVVTAVWIATLGPVPRPAGKSFDSAAHAANVIGHRPPRHAALTRAASTTSDDAHGIGLETFDSAGFSRSTLIDNEWLPLKTGTQFVWQGTSVSADGGEQVHRAVLTVTDVTREIEGIETVVCWERDFVNDEPASSGVTFIAQHDDGTVWRLGKYAEEYTAGQPVAASGWVHGIDEGKAQIMMLAAPEAGTTTFSENKARKMLWTDRGLVFQVGQETSVPFGAFKDVLVIHESIEEEPGARRLKYYARGVGLVRHDERGTSSVGKVLALGRIEQLGAAEMAAARDEVRKLETCAFSLVAH